MSSDHRFLQHAGVEVPLICGPMYPCSNPELVAAASEAGAMGVIQPISLSYVHGYELEEGIRYMRSLTSKPLGMNLLIEKSAQRYQQRMQNWLDIALDQGIRFFITSLGKPDWVVRRAHEYGAVVYHDVTEARWAEKALDCGVDGLIAVNNRAGGHAGPWSSEDLYGALEAYNLPLVCAGGISSHEEYRQVLQLGYAAVQMGTRFIASVECSASQLYKQAIVNSQESDIVLSERITGVPVSIINTVQVQRQGLRPNWIERFMLRHRRLKHVMRLILALRSLRAFKTSLKDDTAKHEYWQAGKSVKSIHEILTVKDIVQQIVTGSTVREAYRDTDRE